MMWLQSYDPLGNILLSALVAAIPIAVLLAAIAWWRLAVPVAAGLGLAVALVIAGLLYQMPASAMLGATLYGALYGLFPIGWIILNLMFLYQLSVRKGWFEDLRHGLAKLAPDPRIQLILIAYCLGSFFEGVAGLGTPVAITAVILIQLGFKPLEASGLSLIANTAPVAFGALGTPIIALSAVTGIDIMKLSVMTGRIVPIFSLLVPFWLVFAMAGFRGLMGVWPAALVAGIGFAVPQFLVSNFHGPWLVDIVASASSLGGMVLLLRYWQPKPLADTSSTARMEQGQTTFASLNFWRGCRPWVILSLFIFIWGVPQTKKLFDGVSQIGGYGLPSGVTSPKVSMPGLDGVVVRVPPVAPVGAAPEKAVFSLNWLSATGTGILLAAILVGVLYGQFGPKELLLEYFATVRRVRLSLLTISGMVALGYVTKYSGADATLGIALAGTGVFYPFVGTLLGWLGVALTGSDTASNILFGGLQKVTAEQLNLSPVLMGAANTVGGVMGKMIDAQSIMVASTATGWVGNEGSILRYVFLHSFILACLVGLAVTAYAYIPFLARFVIH